MLIRYLFDLRSHLKPTSQIHVILDIQAFLKYLIVANLPKVRLTEKSIICVLGSWRLGERD